MQPKIIGILLLYALYNTSLLLRQLWASFEIKAKKERGLCPRQEMKDLPAKFEHAFAQLRILLAHNKQYSHWVGAV